MASSFCSNGNRAMWCHVEDENHSAKFGTVCVQQSDCPWSTSTCIIPYAHAPYIGLCGKNTCGDAICHEVENSVHISTEAVGTKKLQKTFCRFSWSPRLVLAEAANHRALEPAVPRDCLFPGCASTAAAG